MSLIDEVEKLRGLEQQATGGQWGYDGMHNEIHYEGPNHDEPYFLIISECRSSPDQTIDDDQFGHHFDHNFAFIAKMRNLAPAMLEVLGCHEEYDSAVLKAMKSVLIGAGVQGGSPMMNVLDRHIRAAALMEKEEH